MRRDSAKRHIWGCAPRRGLWPPNLNSAEVLVRRIYPPPQSFIVLCLLVRKLSCWHTQTHKQTDFRRKHSTFFATLRRWVILTILASLTTCCPTTWMPIHAHFLGGWFLTCKAPQTDLVFLCVPSGSGHAILQVSVFSGYDLFHPGYYQDTHTHASFRPAYMNSSASWVNKNCWCRWR